jgi:hypothetical protein
MPRRQSPRQRRKVGSVMHEFKKGRLKSSTGAKVKNPKQAIAIALSEAGASDPARRKAKKATSSGRRRGGERTRAELYREARRKNLPGRSKMSKAELARALGR